MAAESTNNNVPKESGTKAVLVSDNGLSTSAAAAARRALGQKGQSALKSGKPTSVAKKDTKRVQQTKSSAAGRLRKWERNDPDANSGNKRNKKDGKNDRKRN